MAPKEIVYQPLERSSDDIHDGVLLQQYASKSFGRQRWERITCILCIVATVITNGAWIGLYNYQKGFQAAVGHSTYAPYQGVQSTTNGFPVRVPYVFSTPYVDGNLSTTNKLWEELFPPGFGAIKVEHAWAAENNLPKTQGDAPDGKAIYTVAAFHHLHCLTVIRTSLFQFNNGHKQIDDWSHIVHCIDTIRQQVQCLADPTLGGIGVEHECRDFDALKEWTAERAYLDFLDPAA